MFGRLVADDPQAVVDGHAGLDAAHDDVHGVGEFPGELLGPPRAQKTQHPARQAKAGGQTGAQGDERLLVQEQQGQQDDRPHYAADHVEAAHVVGEAGLQHLGVEAEGRFLGLSILLAQGLEDLPAALVLRRGGGLAPSAVARIAPGDGLGALDGPRRARTLAGERQAEARHGDEAQHGGQQDDQGRTQGPTPPRPGLRPVPAPVRSSGRGPRSGGGRSRSSGDGRPRCLRRLRR